MARETRVRLTGDRDLSRRLPVFNFCVMFAIGGMLVAIMTRQPDLLALITPFVLAPAAALALWRPVEGTVTIRFPESRVIEGETITVNVDVASPTGIDRIEIELLPSNRLVQLGTLRAVTSLAAGEKTTLSFTVEAKEWGVAKVDKMTIRVSDRFAMFGGRVTAKPEQVVTIGIPEDRATASLEAERFRRIVGSHLSNDRGRGMEIADVRRFQQGDSARDLNWRISNRHQEPWVTLRHPDRSTTVIIIVDAHDGDLASQQITQRQSVTAALALSRGHLAMHDRVGLLVVGHTLVWLPPKLGRNQLFQITDSLMSVSNAPEASLRMYRPPAVSSIPSNAIVVAVSPLLDPHMVRLVAEVRGRGNPVSVLVPTIEDTTTPHQPWLQSRIDAHARRLASVEQQIGVQSLRDRGVAIVPWTDDTPVITVIDSIQRLRQSMTRMRAV